MVEKYYNKETNTLTLPYDFNEELCNLSSNTKVIIFEEDYSKKQHSLFNQPVNNLPDSITHLTFGRHFNQPVNYLPNSITHLTFGCEFNQSVGHQGCEDINCPRNLPNSITHLTFGISFNRPVDNLPLFLQQIQFNYKTKEEILSIMKKVPFGCKILNERDEEIFLQ